MDIYMIFIINILKYYKILFKHRLRFLRDTYAPFNFAKNFNPSDSLSSRIALMHNNMTFRNATPRRARPVLYPPNWSLQLGILCKS